MPFGQGESRKLTLAKVDPEFIIKLQLSIYQNPTGWIGPTMAKNANLFQAASLSSLPRRQIFITFAAVMLAMFLSALDQTVVGTAMPRIIADLGGFSKYTWVVTAYIITSAVMVPITGKMIDLYGRKWFYIAGIGIFLLGSLLCGFSRSMTELIFFRGFQGIGAGIMMANAWTVVADLFAPAERGKYVGYISGVFGLSSVIGPTIGGFLTDSISWHWVFWVNIPLGLVIIYLFIKFFPHVRPDNMKHKLDFGGLAALILCVVPALIALSWGGVEYPWSSPYIIGMFILAGVMAAIFILVEWRAAEPVIPLSLFKNGIVTVSIIATFLTSIGMFGTTTFIPLFFQGILGSSATASGNYLIPMMLGVLVGSLTAGQLLARAGGHYKVLAIIGTAVMAVGTFLLSRMGVATPYSTAVIFMVITGLGLGITMPVFTIAVQNAVSPSIIGVATSTSSFFRSIGGSVGLAVLGSVMSNRFAAYLMGQMPASLVAAVPADRLSALANNPQALVSPQAQANLKQMVDQAGQSALFTQILNGIRQALASSISEVFIIGTVIVVLGLAAAIFLKEIPLRKHNAPEQQTPRDEKQKPE
jgi:EmrB/QacA subfamily drug resistance transporter